MAKLKLAQDVVQKKYMLNDDDFFILLFKRQDYWERSRFGLNLVAALDISKLLSKDSEEGKSDISDQDTLSAIKNPDSVIQLLKERLESTIVGWENVVDENGEDIPYSFHAFTQLLDAYPDILDNISEDISGLLEPSSKKRKKSGKQ